MTSDPGPRPRLLLTGSGDRRYREYILAAVSAHCDLWLLDAHEVTWQAPYVTGSTTVPGIREPQELAAAARQVTGQWPADGVFCYDETLVHAAAQAAEALGLPGPPAHAVLACRDKALTRSVLAAAGIPQPSSTAVRSQDEALAAASATGYPVVIKARGLAGSIGVVRAESPAAVAAAFAAASTASFPGVPGYDAGVLVEEYLHGPEISVDCVVADGACTITALARKQTGLDPFFEETGHTVDAGDPLLDDAVLRDQLDRVHKALEYTRGATHTEFRLTRPARAWWRSTPGSAAT